MENKIAEEAAGIKQVGKLVCYDRRGIKMPYEEANAVVRMGESVEVPGAGDWCFGVKSKDGWSLAYQENRYPYHGFKYAVDSSPQHSGYATYADLVDAVINV